MSELHSGARQVKSWTSSYYRPEPALLGPRSTFFPLYHPAWASQADFSVNLDALLGIVSF